jgi:hypothetical protein
VGTTATVTVGQGSVTGYFDLIGEDTAAPEVRIYGPVDVFADGNGGIWFADFYNYRVRKLAGGMLTTVAGSGSSTASLDSGGSALLTGLRPRSVAVDRAGNAYVSSDNGYVVYRVTPGGMITVVAGTQGQYGTTAGAPGQGRLAGPFQVTLGGDGSLYIAAYDYGLVRKVASGAVALESIARAGGVVTGTVLSTAGFEVGQSVFVTGVTDAAYNGEYVLTAVTATTFSYAQAGADGASSGGAVERKPADASGGGQRGDGAGGRTGCADGEPGRGDGSGGGP